MNINFVGRDKNIRYIGIKYHQWSDSSCNFVGMMNRIKK